MRMLGSISWAGQVQDEAKRVTGMVLQAYGRVHSQHLHVNRSVFPDMKCIIGCCSALALQHTTLCTLSHGTCKHCV